VRARKKESEYRGFDVISTGKQGQFHKSPSTDTIPFFKSRECAALKRIKADVVNSGATLRHIELHSAASRGALKSKPRSLSAPHDAILATTCSCESFFAAGSRRRNLAVHPR